MITDTVVHVQRSITGKPKVSMLVFKKITGYDVAAQGIFTGWIRPVHFDILTIESVKPIHGTDPDKAPGILINIGVEWIRQSFGARQMIEREWCLGKRNCCVQNTDLKQQESEYIRPCLALIFLQSVNRILLSGRTFRRAGRPERCTFNGNRRSACRSYVQNQNLGSIGTGNSCRHKM